MSNDINKTNGTDICRIYVHKNQLAGQFLPAEFKAIAFVS